MPPNPIQLRSYPACGTLAAVLRKDAYGSLSNVGTRSVHRQLVTIGAQMRLRTLMVDLSLVPYFGAAFLDGLLALNKRLHADGKCLVVCGDRFGLTSVARFPDLFPVFPSTEAALCRTYAAKALVCCFGPSIVCSECGTIDPVISDSVNDSF